MSLPRPSLFIGSSTEGLAVAHALQELLHHDMDPTVWSQGLFQPTASLLARQYRSVRDNVVFEYGLFVGTLGLERCLLLTPFAAPDEVLHRFTHSWDTEPLSNDRAVLKAGVGGPMDDDFPREAILRVFAFLEAVSDAVLSGRIPEPQAQSAFGPVVKLFWPNAATLLAFPGPAAELWNPPPQLANLYTRWEATQS